MRRWKNMHDRVISYLNTRRKMGYELLIEGQELHRFARFAVEHGHDGAITIELALAWANASERYSNLYRARRLEVVRGLAKYCSLFEPGTEVPIPGQLGAAHRRTRPHIYSEKELISLLNAAADLGPDKSLRPATIRCLFGLLASTGLRVSEALRLKRCDIDLERGLLTIRMTKFRKSRYVPLHSTTVAALQDYSRLRNRLFPLLQSPFFFLAADGRPLNYRQALYAFQCIRKRLDWESSSGRMPRIHDLRHTFACRRLLTWYQDGTDIDWAIALLSTYLGHGKVTDTYWYLTGIPELMAVAAKRFENLAQEKREAGDE